MILYTSVDKFLLALFTVPICTLIIEFEALLSWIATPAMWWPAHGLTVCQILSPKGQPHYPLNETLISTCPFKLSNNFAFGIKSKLLKIIYKICMISIYHSLQTHFSWCFLFYCISQEYLFLWISGPNFDMGEGVYEHYQAILRHQQDTQEVNSMLILSSVRFHRLRI